MSILNNKYIKNIFSLLFFVAVTLIILDSVLRPIIGSYLLEEKVFLGIVGFVYFLFFIYQIIRKEINIVSILFLILVLVSIIASIANNIYFTHYYISVFYHVSLIFIFSFFSRFKMDLSSKVKFVFFLTSIILFIYAFASLIIFILTTYFDIILPFDTWRGIGGNNRLYGITGNAAITGVLAYMGIIIQIYLLAIAKKKNIFFLLYTMLIILVETAVLILSDARGSIISLSLLVFMIIVYFFMTYNFKCKYSKIAIIAVSIIAMIAILLFAIYHLLGIDRPSMGIEAFSLESFELFLETISSARYSLWKETVQMVMQKPLFGVGIDNLAPAADALLKTGTIVTYRFEGPHNVLLDVAVSSGLIGLGISLVIFFFIFRSCYILMRKRYTFSNVVLVSGIVGMFIISLFDYGIFFRGRFMSALFWMFAGYAYCLAKRTKS